MCVCPFLEVPVARCLSVNCACRLPQVFHTQGIRYPLHVEAFLGFYRCPSIVSGSVLSNATPNADLFETLRVLVGYHRCFAHKAYDAHWILKLFWLCAGAAAVQGSARWWAYGHRAHHRYTDTEKDPYNSVRGFWYAHIGWLVLKQVCTIQIVGVLILLYITRA